MIRPRRRAPATLAAGLICLPVLLGFATAWSPDGVASVRAASGTAHYVDCGTGSDSAAGTSPGTAWKSPGPASHAALVPGDSILLKRGCRWTGPLKVSASGTADAPITVGAYGDGELPVVENHVVEIDITGSYVTVEDVHVRADPPTVDTACRNQPAGVRFGIRVRSGAAHVLVRDTLVTELYGGVRLDPGSHDNHVLHNTFRNNNMKSNVASSDSGATAIDVQGDNNEIGYNTISGSDACSRFFGGRDGTAVSIFAGIGNVVHHNTSFQNHAFIEVGNPRAAHNLIIYNTDRSTLPLADFLVVHGNNSRYGPVDDTRAAHNTSILTAPDSQSMITVGDVAGTNFSVHANIMWSNGVIAGRKAVFDEGDNIFWASDGRPYVGFTLAATSQAMDPHLVDARGGDFHLLPDSPAIDAVRPMDLGTSGRVDMAGTPVPQGYAPDIGAYEYVPSAPAVSGAPVVAGSGAPIASGAPPPP